MPRLAALFLAAVTAAAAQTPQQPDLTRCALEDCEICAREAAPAAQATAEPEPAPAPRETHRARFRRRTKAVATVALGVAVFTAYVMLRAYTAN